GEAVAGAKDRAVGSPVFPRSAPGDAEERAARIRAQGRAARPHSRGDVARHHAGPAANVQDAHPRPDAREREESAPEARLAHLLAAGLEDPRESLRSRIAGEWPVRGR